MFVCISSFISTADRVEHVLPQAHLRLPGVAPTQLVQDPPSWSHHGAHCAVGLVIKNLLTPRTGLLACWHLHRLYYLLTDNITHIWQTLNVKGLEHNVGCLGKEQFSTHLGFFFFLLVLLYDCKGSALLQLHIMTTRWRWCKREEGRRYF